MKNNEEIIYNKTNKATTKEGYDLLIKIGEKGRKKSHPSYIAKRGAKRLQRAIEGEVRSFLKESNIIGGILFQYDVTKSNQEIYSRLTKKSIVNTIDEAENIMKTIENSWSFQRGNGSICFGDGYIKVWKKSDGYGFRYSNLIEMDGSFF